MSTLLEDVATRDAADVEREALERDWYHTIDLGRGRTTRGTVDLRKTAPTLLPASLAGRSALDVGTFDGFWAYSLERLGAEQVTAIDLPSFDDTDLPPRNRGYLHERSAGQVPGERFALAHRLLDSKVRRVETRIYDLTPERIGGQVDFAVVSDLLLHLRDPVGGLEAVRSCLKPGGTLMLSEQVNVRLSLVSPRRPAADFQPARYDYNWWEANYWALLAWLHQAGFTARRKRFFRLDAHAGQAAPHVAFDARPDPRFEPSWRGPVAAPRD